jgi:transposase
MEKRKRRAFSAEYKAEVVELICKSGKHVGAVARELDLTETAVRRWFAQAEIDSGRGPAGVLTTAEREELARLRRQVKTLGFRFPAEVLDESVALTG